MSFKKKKAHVTRSTLFRQVALAPLFLTLTISAYTQNNNKDTAAERAWARQELKSALHDKRQHNLITPNFVLLDSKQKAVSLAEHILFEIYGAQQIESEKPYRVYNVEGYWIIGGTLHEGWLGGTFLMIVNSHNCEIVRLTHGK